MKKIISTVLLLTVLLSTLSFAGCHGGKKLASFNVPESFDTSRNYELTFWAKNDTNKTQVNVYNKAAEEFSKLYPNIKVNIRYYTDYNVIYQDVITNISTGTTPNICISYPDHVATYLTGAGTVAPLDDLMSNKKYGLGGSELEFEGPEKEEISPAFLSEGYLDGVCYLLPFMRSTEACYINKTYVESLGYTLPDMLTWDFIWEVSEKATEKGDDGLFKVNGQKVMIPFIYKSTDNLALQLFWQNGVEYSDEDGNIKVFNDGTRNILKSLVPHVSSGAFSTFKISGYPANFLNAGQCIFAIDSTAGATWMGPEAPLCDISEDRIVDFEMAVRPVPQVNTEKPLMMSQGPSVCIFNKEDPQEVLASWLFAQYLLTNRVQIDYSKTEGYLPVTLKAQQDEEYKSYLAASGSDTDEHYSIKIDAVKILMEHQDDTFVTAVFNGSASLREAAMDMIERVTKSVRRKEAVDDAYIDAMFADIPVKFHLDRPAADTAAGK